MSDENGEEKKKSFDWTFIKGFAAGLLVSHLSKNLMLGFLIGTVSGFYVEQNFRNIPDVKTEASKILSMVQDAAGKSGRGK